MDTPDAREPAERVTSIVIPVHNAVEYTAHCLDSIDRHTPEAHEIIVVDNGSTDGTADWLIARDRDGLIRNSRNMGFSVAANQGMAQAIGDPVVVLNNDTLVTPGWLSALHRALDRDPRIGIAAPMSNFVTGGQLVHPVPYSDTRGPDLDEFARTRATLFPDMGFGVERLSGLCMAISRRVVDAIGGFDPIFVIGNFEDDDYSVRAGKAGFRLWVCQDSFIHHFGSRTFSLLDEERDQLLRDNALRFIAKWELPEGVNPKLLHPTRSFDPTRDVIPLTVGDGR